jgi:hypothetical protein
VSRVWDLPTTKFVRTEPSLGNFIAFYFSFALPLFEEQDRRKLSSFFRAPKPEPRPPSWAVTRTAYAELQSLAKAGQGELVIVVPGGKGRGMEVPYELFPPAAVVVNTQSRLFAEAHKRGMSYEQAYFAWDLSTHGLLDVHPNARAHEIIADEIVRKLKEREPSSSADKDKMAE